MFKKNEWWKNYETYYIYGSIFRHWLEWNKEEGNKIKITDLKRYVKRLIKDVDIVSQSIASAFISNVDYESILKKYRGDIKDDN